MRNFGFSAESKGFEPLDAFTHRWFSRPVLSTISANSLQRTLKDSFGFTPLKNILYIYSSTKFFILNYFYCNNTSTTYYAK
jgi:hypothetical protein